MSPTDSNSPAPVTLGPWFSPTRLLALSGWIVAVALLLGGIAHVAQSQVQRGQDFQYASTSPTATTATAPTPPDGARLAAVTPTPQDGDLRAVRYTR